MRVYPGRRGVQPWEFRGPYPDSENWSADGEAPHALTQRVSWTCPTGYWGLLTMVYVSARRATAPTTARVFKIQILVAYGTVLIEAHSRSNVVDGGESLASGCNSLIPEGVTVDIYTQDDSTGGTVDYRASFDLICYTI